MSSHVTSVPVLAEFSFMRQRQKCANVKTLPLTFCNASAMTRTRSNELTIQKPELIVKELRRSGRDPELQLARFRDMSRSSVTFNAPKTHHNNPESKDRAKIQEPRSNGAKVLITTISQPLILHSVQSRPSRT